jgi:succinoglycan biosynthesis transport protein ExoP
MRDKFLFQPAQTEVQAYDGLGSHPGHFGPLSNTSGAPEPGGVVMAAKLIRRHFWLVALAGLIGAGCGLVVALSQEKTYQANVSLEIQSLNENYLNFKDLEPGSSAESNTQGYLQTEVKLLKSTSLLKRVEEKLKLRDRAAFAYKSSRFTQWLEDHGLTAPRKMDPRAVAIDKLAQNLKVVPPTDNRLVEVSFESTDPTSAAEVANTLAIEFIEQNLEVRWAAAQSNSQWLEPKIEDLKKKLEQSEAELQAYALATGLMISSADVNVTEEKLSQIQGNLSAAQADLAIKQAQNELAGSSAPDALPRTIDDGPSKDYQAKLTDLQRQMAELRTSYTPEHYKVRHLAAQITELETALSRERGNIGKRASVDYEAAKRRVDLLARAYGSQVRTVADQAAKSVRYNSLKNEVKTNRDIYAAMLRELKQAGVASAIRANNIRVVDPAEVPSRPHGSLTGWALALGLVCGCFTGVVFAFARENLDQSIRDPGESEAYLSVPELGVIPSARIESGVRRAKERTRQDDSYSYSLLDAPAGRNGADAGRKLGRGIDQPNIPELASWERKPSILAESYRAAMTSLQFAGRQDGAPRVIVFTSAGPAEGKTTSVCNMGIALADIGKRVLLIDADDLRPRLDTIFSMANECGLTALLADSKPVSSYLPEELARPTRVPGLSVLTNGPATTCMAQLLNKARTAELLTWLRKDYDFVLIDTPPVSQINARVLGRIVDGVVLVCRANHTDRSSVMTARNRLLEDGTSVLGTILNDFDQKRGSLNYQYANTYRKRDRGDGGHV